MNTGGGVLDYAKQPTLYKSVYLLLLLVGIFTVLAILVINVVPYLCSDLSFRMVQKSRGFSPRPKVRLVGNLPRVAWRPRLIPVLRPVCRIPKTRNVHSGAGNIARLCRYCATRGLRLQQRQLAGGAQRLTLQSTTAF
jgi:hypothetical protein